MHPNFLQVERWANPGWIPLFAATHVRYGRGTIAAAPEHRALCNQGYDDHGIRYSASFNNIAADGSFDYADAADYLSKIKSLAIDEPLGVHKMIGVEGANEYQHDELWERRFEVNASDECARRRSATGWHDSRLGNWPPDDNGVGGDTYPSASHGWTTSDRVQVRPALNATLPAPLQEFTPYHVLAPSGATMKLATLAAPTVPIDFSGVGSGNFFVTPWAARFVDFQAWIWNAVTTDPVLGPAHAAGEFLVRSGSIWQRQSYHYRQLEAEGGFGASCDRCNLHLYNAARKPSQYNGETGDDPITEAILDAQRMAPLPVDITEFGWNMTNTYGGTTNSSTCTGNIASKYIGRAICEHWLLHTNLSIHPPFGVIGRCSFYSPLDNLKSATRFGLVSYDEPTNVYFPRFPYYTLRNLNSFAVEGVWDPVGASWSFPTFTPSAVEVSVIPDIAYATPEFIKWFLLRKAGRNAVAADLERRAELESEHRLGDLRCRRLVAL